MTKIEEGKSVDHGNGEFQPPVWYSGLIEIARNPDPRQRYNSLVQLHQQTLDFYLPAISAITPEMAAMPSSDGRPLSLVAAHIMGWEKWQTQVFSDPNREERLQKQMRLQGFMDNGEVHDFETVDDFNAYISERYKQTSWEEIQKEAVETAEKLQAFFPASPDDKWIDFLEDSPQYNWRILPDTTISVPSGWYLWMVTLEHEAVEHREDLIGASLV